MNTQKNVCNIIWVDDEIDTLLSEDEVEIFENRGFNLVGTARTFAEFAYLMDLSYDKVDAVITDANFNTNSLAPNSERDLSGLVKIKECIAKYNEKRSIPFYIFTGRGAILDEKFEDGQLDYFYHNNRYFTKSQFAKMLQQIRIDVEHINSASFRIRNKYAAELKAASLIEKNEEDLMKALLYEETRDRQNTEDYFNLIRKIVERILEESKKLQITPNNIKLSGWKRFLANEDKIFCLKAPQEEIMPKPLMYGLDYLEHIIQDGSHGEGDLELGIDAYVRESKDINLFRSVLYIAMDLCLWLEKYEMSNTKQKQRWSINRDAFKCIGKITQLVGKDGWVVYVCENYQIGSPRNDEYSVGDTIGVIKEVSSNRHPFSYIKEDGTEISVDKYTIAQHIVKLS